MNAPAAVTPPYKHTPLFPLGGDTTPYRKLTAEGVRVERAGQHELVVVEREALRTLAEAAFTDINHLLRPGHLKQLRAILDDPQASDNDKFVAYDFLKNANIATGGVLPMCQDTGTAIIMGKKGRLVPALPPRHRHRRHVGGVDDEDGQARLLPLSRRPSYAGLRGRPRLPRPRDGTRGAPAHAVVGRGRAVRRQVFLPRRARDPSS